MRVLVNALGLRNGGGATLIREQLTALAALSPDLELHTLITPWSELGDLPGTIETVPVRGVPMRFGYEQTILPFRRADVLYCVGNFAPAFARAPVVLMIQNAHYYQTKLSTRERLRPRLLIETKANHMALRRADKVVAVSQSLADVAAGAVPKSSRKIEILYSAAPIWPETSTAVESVPALFYLTVSGDSPHKRLGDTVAGWVRAVKAMPEPIPLVVVGQVSQSEVARHRAVAEDIARYLTFTGSVADRSQLKWLYEHASLAIQMSALESFSFTPVEAGSLGCPLVISDIPVHREVVGNNATFIPVGDIGALSRALAKVQHGWAPGSRVWTWPVRWQDNAAALLSVFRSVS